MKSLTLLSLAASAAAAVPSVTPVPVAWPGTCTSWPSWLNTGPGGPDTTGSIMFVPSNVDDTTINGLPLQAQSLPWQGSSRNLLGVTFVASRHFAKSYFRCSDGIPNIATSNPWQNLTIARDSNNAHLLIDAPEAKTYAPEIYYLEGSDGKRLDGVYLGALNQTKWGFAYHEGTCGTNGKAGWPWLEAKLLGLPEDDENPPTAGYPAEWEGFLKVVVY
ncbi:hypothetical protein N0V90_001271 [Kalmusia sp. IMI 367209]|nr:hypothetical protein N0V90_001271 [Kalmusia sp. IMI 367209]